MKIYKFCITGWITVAVAAESKEEAGEKLAEEINSGSFNFETETFEGECTTEEEMSNAIRHCDQYIEL